MIAFLNNETCDIEVFTSLEVMKLYYPKYIIGSYETNYGTIPVETKREGYNKAVYTVYIGYIKEVKLKE